jgi:hypothetical protein
MEQRTDEHTDDIKREDSEDKFRKDFWQLSEGESASTIFYKLKEGLLEFYSSPDLYSPADTSSGNVFVFTEYYSQYKSGAFNSDMKTRLETEISDAEYFGNLGVKIYVLPEKIYFNGEEYNGKIPDALMDDYLVEFKNLQSVKYSQFKKQLKDGLMKSDVVYLVLPQDSLIVKNNERSIFSSISGEIKDKGKYDGKIIIYSVKFKGTEAYKIKNGTLERVPLTRLGDLPQPRYNIASAGESVKVGESEFSTIKNGTQDRVPFGRLGDLPQPEDNISRKEASVNRGGKT